MLKIPCLIKANSLRNYAKQINSLDKAVLYINTRFKRS